MYYGTLYDQREQVGEGTYAYVYKGLDRQTGRVVAIKQQKMSGDKKDHGVPITFLREVMALKKLRHRNIVNLIEAVVSKPGGGNRMRGNLYMVFEYLPYDLSGLMDSGKIKLTSAHVRCYMKQLLDAMRFMHDQQIIHRDIKGANILVTSGNIIKLADVGLARNHVNHGRKKNSTKRKMYTNRVTTLWYRAPELLLGAVDYGEEIDMWSAGMLFAEWVYVQPVATGSVEIEQLSLIFRLCGTPTHENWKDHDKLPLWNVIAPRTVYGHHTLGDMEERFKNFPKDALDLTKKMLQLDPKKRWTACQAYDHDYFWYPKSSPHHTPEPSELPRLTVCEIHEFQRKQERDKQRQSRAGKRRHREQLRKTKKE